MTDITAKQLAEAEEAMRAAANVYLKHAREIAFFVELNRAVLADGDVG